MQADLESTGTEFIGGEMSTPTTGQGGHNIFCTPQHFVMKTNVVVQISSLHYCWKLFPSIKPGHK